MTRAVEFQQRYPETVKTSEIRVWHGVDITKFTGAIMSNDSRKYGTEADEQVTTSSVPSLSFRELDSCPVLTLLTEQYQGPDSI